MEKRRTKSGLLDRQERPRVARETLQRVHEPQVRACREERGGRVGRVRRRRSKNHGTRFLAIARLHDVDVALGTYDTFEDAVDAWQSAEVAARRRAGGPTLAASRVSFAELVELYFESAALEATTRKSYRSHCTAHLLPGSAPRRCGRSTAPPSAPG
jgi:hypothetical protein